MVRVLLAEDHTLVRTAIRSLLSQAPGIEVVGETSDGREAVRLTGELTPDVAVLDIAMPRLNGIDAARQIRSEHPATRVVMLSMHADQRFVHEAMSTGALGYVLKDSAFEELLGAIDSAMNGRIFLGSAIAGMAKPATDGSIDAAEPLQPVRRLTPREREVLQLIGEGHSNAEIAQALGLSVRTVETHRENMMKKLDIHSVAGLTRYAIRQGLCSLDA